MKKPMLAIATHNLHKLKEIRRILGKLPYQVAGLDRFPAYTVRETGKTLEENALLKARAGVSKTGCACLSDDTGLEVKALKGAPGVYSARYAGYGCSFEDNNRKLLRALKGVPPAKRAAVFRCVVAFAAPDGTTRFFEGRCPGRITDAVAGKNGFGYDPVFAPAGLGGKTFADLSLAQKNAVSHRAKAFRKAAAWLKKKG